MTVFIIRRLLQALVVVFIMSLIVFFGVSVIGDPLDSWSAPRRHRPKSSAIRIAFGLDKPIHIQYCYFVWAAWLEGEFRQILHLWRACA